MYKKFVVLFTTMIICIMCTGCWDKVEINKRAFVTTIAIDKPTETERKQNDNCKFKVSVEIPNVALFGIRQFPTKEIEFNSIGFGDDFGSALKQIQMKSPNELDISQTKVLIISQQFADGSKSIDEIFNSVIREKKFSRKMIVVVSEKNAQELIDMIPKENPLTGLYLYERMKPQSKDGQIIECTLNTIAKDYVYNKTTVAPIAKLIDNKKRIDIDEGIIIKDKQKIAIIDDREVCLLDMINRSTVNTLSIPLLDESETVYEILHSERKMKVKLGDDQRLHMYLDVFVEGDISREIHPNPESSEAYKQQLKNEKHIENILENELKSMITRCQVEFNADLVKVEEYISKFRYEDYKKTLSDFDAYFRDMKVHVNVDAKIRKKGILR